MSRPFSKQSLDDLAKSMDNPEEMRRHNDFQILKMAVAFDRHNQTIATLPPLPGGEFDHLWQDKTEFHHLPIKPPFNIVTPIGHPWSTREIHDYGAQLLYQTFSVNDIVDLLTDHLEATRVV